VCSDQVNTEFAKVLVATAQQIQTMVVDKERQELSAQMADAEVRLQLLLSSIFLPLVFYKVTLSGGFTGSVSHCQCEQ
jgi:hypothetical protein